MVPGKPQRPPVAAAFTAATERTPALRIKRPQSNLCRFSVLSSLAFLPPRGAKSIEKSFSQQEEYWKAS